MSDYIISCCSTADLTKEHFEKRNISYICFHYELDGKEYEDDLGQSMPFDKFYKAMQDGAMTKTSQVNAEEYEQYFEKFLKEGKDILIGFNPKFLIDALKVIDDETIDIYLVNPKAPCFIRDEEETYTYLILPVNINQNQAR